jgi:hypothetical protein
MTNIVWIGIAVGVFFAGLGIGYAVFQSYNQPNFATMTPQQMQQMMNDPKLMSQWQQTMMNNPQAMNEWMNMMMQNPQAGQWMRGSMMGNQQMMQNWMTPMMNDPQLRQQMYDTMFQHQQFMQGMMSNQQFQNQWLGPMMEGQGTMGSGMMGSGMGGMMMGTPITQESDILKTITNIESLLDKVSISYRDGNTNDALSYATTAYLENYEYIEGSIAAKDRALMEKIELMLRRDLRHMINVGEPANDVDAQIDSIKEELAKVKKLF